MLIRRADRMEGVPMEMPGAEGVEMRLMVGRSDGAPTFAMRHFIIEPGGHSPRHQHDYEHEVLVLGGRARVEHDDEFQEIGPGDVVFIEPNKLHQFVNVGDGQFEFICLVPVTHDCGKPTPGS